ncbi:hypothetical protein VTK56DRAFT_226 [Thermocarpiscus australiensis]
MNDGAIAIAIVPDLPDDPSTDEVSTWETKEPKEYKRRIMDPDAEILDQRLGVTKEGSSTSWQSRAASRRSRTDHPNQGEQKGKDLEERENQRAAEREKQAARAEAISELQPGSILPTLDRATERPHAG